VLRLYALQPSTARPETVARILLRALAQLPAADYRTCAYLVPERLQVGGGTHARACADWAWGQAHPYCLVKEAGHAGAPCGLRLAVP
jgi:GAF domain-containing protein